MKIKGPTFELREYAFSEIPENSKDKFKDRVELFDKHMDIRDTSLDESLNIHEEVRKISNKYGSLVTIQDHVQNPLNLVVSTKN